MRIVRKVTLVPLLAVVLIFFSVFCACSSVVRGSYANLKDDDLLKLIHPNKLPFMSRHVATVATLQSGDQKCMNGGQPYRGVCKCPDESKFSGLHCQMCQEDGACSSHSGTPSECNKALAIRGMNKNFQCKIDQEFISLLGNGRKVDGVVDVSFSTTDPDGFAKSKTGEAKVVLYRIEPNFEFVDPFFACNMTGCGMEVKKEAKQGKGPELEAFRRVFKIVSIVGEVVLVVLCALLAFLHCFSSRLKRQRVLKIATRLGIALICLTFVFIAVMLILMRPTLEANNVIYKCSKTKCECSEDPKNISYQPFCSKYPINSILQQLKNGITVVCDLDSKDCKLSFEGVSLSVDLVCSASECVNTEKFPFSPFVESSNIMGLQRILLIVVAVVVLVITLVIVAHILFLRLRSRRRAAKFIHIFGFYEPQSNSTGVLTVKEVNNENDISETNLLHLEQHGLSGSTTRNNTGSGIISYDEEVAVPDVSTSLVQLGTQDMNDISGPETRPVVTGDVETYRRVLMSSFELCMKNVSYSVPVSEAISDETTSERFILHQVSLQVVSGDVLAILGSSGAGKTTCLDILSARRKQGRIEGTIFFNGVPLGTSSRTLDMYRNIIGYVSQDDTLLPALTVYQTIEYAARLKLPRVFSNKIIHSIVRNMIDVLKLQQCEHTIIGDGSDLRGVSGGERRRVSIAVELLANPRILFLDEPTSGLDAISAKRVIEAVVTLAKKSPMQIYAPYFFAFKPIVVFSIHQPSQEIFELFDKVLLLSRGINLYFGPAHNAAETLEATVRRLSKSDSNIPSRVDHLNHAEYLMKLSEAIDDDTHLAIQEEGVQKAHASHEDTEFFHNAEEGNRNDLSDDHGKLISGNEILDSTTFLRIYYANMYQQVSLLTSRAVSCILSSFNLVAGHAALTAFLGAMMMVLYHEQHLDLNGSLNRAGSITFLLLVLSLISLSCLEQLFAERKLFVVETENGYYRTFPYLISKIIVDIIPFRIIPVLVLASIIYFPIGFRVDNSIHFFWFIFILTVFSVCVTFISLCVGILMRKFGSAALLSSAITLWNFVFGGFLVQGMTLPVFLRPFQFISPFFLAFESLLINELGGQICIFSPVDETGKPSPFNFKIMCEQYLFNFGLVPGRFNMDVGLLVAFTVGLMGLAWLLLAKCTSIAR